ncbi:hypothetical protein AGABI2DRAFT_79926 [Agaricus bisporus var. bisporus H97]|uniref:hypothetical protein n=1 Tax=Agaricus bisporus var. bisporus (strain H97 / ATCC MYA-4626 / FGSC 10389) TaxID=936046 RepID=UPI00029F7C85|nr:hypothetical protein AGABI2DRAFT_79926 [Agaricus bisporus var. bisporus H97]EKV41703.1 hypothetical protein AGABI2DRAFT_79926 [Agaricus bisporus var. bisporus H97]
MPSEETPLLLKEHDLIFERFSPEKRKMLVAIVSWCGLIAFFSAGSFIPCIPQIAQELNSTGEVISYAVSICVFAGAIGGLIGSKYAKFYGRRPCYIYHLPIMILGSLGTALSRTVPHLMAWRFVQAMGASPGISVGAGVIGDIYKLEERGTPYGSYFGIGLLGFALSPTISGITAHYWSWRAVHYSLAASGFGALVCIFFFFPETSHPNSRGIDEYRKAGKALPKWRPVILNPLSQLLMLRSPILLSMVYCFVFYHPLTVPLAYTIGKRYNIENEALVGLLILPLGVGNAVGAPMSGWISDQIVIYYKAKRGYWCPEDRLRACLYSAYLPITVLASALVTKYVDGTPGLALNMVLFFMNGIGVSAFFIL